MMYLSRMYSYQMAYQLPKLGQNRSFKSLRRKKPLQKFKQSTWEKKGRYDNKVRKKLLQQENEQ